MCHRQRNSPHIKIKSKYKARLAACLSSPSCTVSLRSRHPTVFWMSSIHLLPSLLSLFSVFHLMLIPSLMKQPPATVTFHWDITHLVHVDHLLIQFHLLNSAFEGFILVADFSRFMELCQNLLQSADKLYHVAFLAKGDVLQVQYFYCLKALWKCSLYCFKQQSLLQWGLLENIILASESLRVTYKCLELEVQLCEYKATKYIGVDWILIEAVLVEETFITEIAILLNRSLANKWEY